MAGQKKAPKSNAQKRRSMMASRSRMNDSESRGSVDEMSRSSRKSSTAGIAGTQSSVSVDFDEDKVEQQQHGQSEPIVYHSKSQQGSASMEKIKEVKPVAKVEGTKPVVEQKAEPVAEQKAEPLPVEQNKSEPVTPQKKMEPVAPKKKAEPAPAAMKKEEPKPVQQPVTPQKKAVEHKPSAPATVQPQAVETPKKAQPAPQVGNGTVAAKTPSSADVLTAGEKTAGCRCTIQ